MFPRATPPEKHDGNMMPEASILQRPEAFDALVDVQLGELVTLELGHHTHNVSSQLFRRQHCFVLMGTSYGCAMSKAKVAAIETSNLGILKGQSTMIATDVDYVVSVRSVVRVHLKETRARVVSNQPRLLRVGLVGYPPTNQSEDPLYKQPTNL
jgi:hypothetical protein